MGKFIANRLYLGSTMRRPMSISRASPVCQICESLFSRPLHTVRTIPIARNNTVIRAQPHSAPAGSRLQDKRLLAAAAAPTRKATEQYTRRAGTTADIRESSYSTERSVEAASQELSSVTNMMTYLENSKSKVLNYRKIPSEADVGAALQACRVVADYIMDESVQPQITHIIDEMDTTASHILSLDKSTPPSRTKAPNAPDTAAERLSTQFRRLVDSISDTAFAILTHPPVFITPALLQQYVGVQARLGKPETLPKAFQLYVSKPVPRETSGSVDYVAQNPHKIANAIEPAVIEKALDTAIEARNLDAAVGVVETGYGTRAFVRAKLARQAALPAVAVVGTPLAAYTLATSFSALQSSMDAATATSVAFAGILAYVGFTASIGLVALVTANDQMRRVTWAPGLPLRRRWAGEEERAGLDRIACAWGFQERWRQGEEEGPEWNSLREYISGKGMVLDRTELMPGMD